MNHAAIVKMPKQDIDRINRLLSIPSLSELTDDQLRDMGANTDYYERIFYADFNDGSWITYDLCSGSENYFDNVVWTSADGREICLDCEYELDADLGIGFEVDGETYAVIIEQEEE